MPEGTFSYVTAYFVSFYVFGMYQSTDGTFASVAPGNCTATQIPYASPTSTDGKTGHLITFTNKYCTC